MGIAADFTTETELPFPVAEVSDTRGRRIPLHPLLFLKALAEQLMIYEKTQVTGVEDGKIYTDYGNVLADTVVFASHYPIVNAPGIILQECTRSEAMCLRCGMHSIWSIYISV